MTLVTGIAVVMLLTLLVVRSWAANDLPEAELLRQIEGFNFAALTNLLDRSESAFLRKRLRWPVFWRINATRMAAALKYLNELDRLMAQLADVLPDDLVQQNARRQIPKIRWVILRLQIHATLSTILPGLLLPASSLYDMHSSLLETLGESFISART